MPSPSHALAPKSASVRGGDALLPSSFGSPASPPFPRPPPRSLHFDGRGVVKAEHTVVHSVRQYSRLRYLRGRGSRQRPVAASGTVQAQRALTRP